MNRSIRNLFCIWLALLVTAVRAIASLPDDAKESFSRGDFARAVGIYQELIKQQGPSADLLYNLGNAFYRSDDPGRAILSYERAKLLAPRDPDLRSNLNLARKSATVFDKPEFDLRVEAVLMYFSRDEWSWLVAGSALSIGAISLVLGIIPIVNPPLRRAAKVSISLAGLMMVLGGVSLYLRRDEAARGIVLGKDSAVRLSPFDKADSLGIPGAGRMVWMGEVNGEFHYVIVPGTDLRGWMRDAEVERIISSLKK